jgi:hypothetical protein
MGRMGAGTILIGLSTTLVMRARAATPVDNTVLDPKLAKL